jgi:hypothetical protein
MKPDFTLDEAQDLAKYFLGPDWKALFLQLGAAPYMLRKQTKPLGVSVQGESWRAAFRAAGVHLPFRSEYAYRGLRVMMGDKAVCTAVSNTMAKRITAALNEHIPDRRGI